jgi:hypothetical protein
LIPVRQTIGGPPNGDCFAACVASVLELPLSEVPNPVGERWREQWGDWLEGRGLSYVDVDLAWGGGAWWRVAPGQLWIATVPSLNHEGLHHSVVMRGFELAHDPSLAERYEAVPTSIVTDMQFLVPLDPAP